jgi:hypothetical protein
LFFYVSGFLSSVFISVFWKAFFSYHITYRDVSTLSSSSVLWVNSSRQLCSWSFLKFSPKNWSNFCINKFFLFVVLRQVPFFNLTATSIN